MSKRFSKETRAKMAAAQKARWAAARLKKNLHIEVKVRKTKAVAKEAKAVAKDVAAADKRMTVYQSAAQVSVSMGEVRVLLDVVRGEVLRAAGV